MYVVGTNGVFKTGYLHMYEHIIYFIQLISETNMWMILFDAIVNSNYTDIHLLALLTSCKRL